MIAILPAIAGFLALTAGDAELVGAASPRPAESRRAPCAGAEHHQFDFWLGDWEVRTPDGKPAGTNRITRILGGASSGPEPAEATERASTRSTRVPGAGDKRGSTTRETCCF